MFLGTFLENFESFEVFPLFCNFCEFRPPRVHWAKIFAEKITSKHVENMFDCFWERFFGQFEQMKFFPVFWSFSKFRPSRVHWARKNRKNYLEQVWTLFQTFFGILKLWNLFDFVDFSWVSTVHWAQRFPSKKSIKTFSGNVFGNVFGRFWKFQSFSFFKVFSKPRPSRVHWRLFSEEKLPQNRFGKCLHNIRDSFGHFRNIEIFHFFQSFPYSTLQGALGTNFTETITSKQVQNMFDCFWERFLGILKNWKFFVFWSFSKFRLSRQHRAFFYEKITSKQFQNLFGHFQEHFWTLLKFQIVFDFFSNFSKFRPSRVHWSLFLTKKSTSKNFENVFEHFWERFWSFWKKKESFSIFLKFSQVSTLQGALGTFFREKTSKQVQNLLGHFWKRVWVSWILRSFCISLKFFDVSTLQGALAKKSRKNHIKTCLDNLGNVFGHFWKFEFFSISVELFRVSTVHWAEFFSVEIIMQHMIKQCFWERFWRILKVSKFFHFFVFFAGFDHPGCTGQKFLPKKLPLSMLKTCLIAFGNVFSGNLKNWKFFQFFEIFPSFDPPG